MYQHCGPFQASALVAQRGGIVACGYLVRGLIPKRLRHRSHDVFAGDDVRFYLPVWLSTVAGFPIRRVQLTVRLSLTADSRVIGACCALVLRLRFRSCGSSALHACLREQFSDVWF